VTDYSIRGAGGGAPLSDATPAAPGTAAAGTGTSASRDDHVHTPTTAAQAGAVAASVLTTEGDLIIGDGTGAPTRLAAGTNGYMMRVVSGRPAWREYAGYGLIDDRPGAAAVREGMIYWTTDAAAGLELSKCINKASGTYTWERIPYGVTATGIALVQAADAAAARAAIGAGGATTYGLDAARPAATGAGVSYAATDTGAVYYDDPATSAWRVTSPQAAVEATAWSFASSTGYASTGVPSVFGGEAATLAVALYINSLPGGAAVLWSLEPPAAGAAGWHTAIVDPTANRISVLLRGGIGLSSTFEIPFDLATGYNQIMIGCTALSGGTRTWTYAIDGACGAHSGTSAGVAGNAYVVPTASTCVHSLGGEGSSLGAPATTVDVLAAVVLTGVPSEAQMVAAVATNGRILTPAGFTEQVALRAAISGLEPRSTGAKPASTTYSLAPVGLPVLVTH
jgi:hypothetical protein